MASCRASFRREVAERSTVAPTGLRPTAQRSRHGGRTPDGGRPLPSRMTRTEVIVIGAGQAGLATSFCLTQRCIPHLVLERGRIAESWRSGRWDSFRLVTPRSACRLPGFAYEGPEPEGFMPRDELVRFFEDYARSFSPPVLERTTVQRVAGSGDGFVVESSAGPFAAGSVVVATGILQSPRVPSVSASLPPTIRQLPASRYRSPDGLPAGAVLVVGTGQSGTSIADELHASGRAVFLSVGSSPRIPRRYRGEDILAWTSAAGLRTLRHGRFSQHAHISEPGPRDLALDALAARGVRLIGHVDGIDGTRLQLSTDVRRRLLAAECFEQELLATIDAWIDAAGIEAPVEPPRLRPSFVHLERADLDLLEEGIASVIWATGYGFDFSWIEADVLDEYGEPRQERGVTSVPGLFFVGTTWRERPLSAYVGNVAGEADHVATHVQERLTSGGGGSEVAVSAP
jgi:putative flavoprotein involved in K+ transport